MNVLNLGSEVQGRTFSVSAGPWPVLGVHAHRDGPERTIDVHLVFLTLSLWWWEGALVHRLPDDEPSPYSEWTTSAGGEL